MAGVEQQAQGGPQTLRPARRLAEFAGAPVVGPYQRSHLAAAAHDRELDEEIGVMGGDLGAPNLKHPPAKVGAYSTAATGTGASGGGSEPAEGPMQIPKD